MGWQMPYLFVFLVMMNALFLGVQVYKQQSYKMTANMHAQNLILPKNEPKDTQLGE